MRLWMVDPRIMCRQHLLGEHLECHMFISHIQQKRDLTGYIESNLLEPCSLVYRHNQLVEEMLRRGYLHHSPISGELDFDYMSEWQSGYIIDIDRARKELLIRCTKCKELYDARDK